MLKLLRTEFPLSPKDKFKGKCYKRIRETIILLYLSQEKLPLNIYEVNIKSRYLCIKAHMKKFLHFLEVQIFQNPQKHLK